MVLVLDDDLGIRHGLSWADFVVLAMLEAAGCAAPRTALARIPDSPDPAAASPGEDRSGRTICRQRRPARHQVAPVRPATAARGERNGHARLCPLKLPQRAGIAEQARVEIHRCRRQSPWVGRQSGPFNVVDDPATVGQGSRSARVSAGVARSEWMLRG